MSLQLLTRHSHNPISPKSRTLVHAAISQPSFYLVTGDKCFLRALVTTPELAEAKEYLNGRVVCLEQLIAQLIVIKGFDMVKQKVVPVRDCDTSLKVAFGSGDHAEEDTTLWALEGCIRDLRQDCPNLLMDFQSL